MNHKKRINIEPFLRLSNDEFISQLKHLNDVGFQSLLPLIKSKAILFNKAFSNPFPQTLKCLKARQCWRHFDLSTELKWVARQINVFKNELSEFSELKLQFETEFLHGNGDRAENILNQIEDAFGQSIWLIENKISMFQEFFGIERQKSFVRSITNSESTNGLVRFLAFHFSLRAEPNLPYFKYNSIVNKALGKIKANEKLFSYLAFRLKSFDEPSAFDPWATLAYDSDSSIVDKFSSFIKVCSSLFSRVPDDLSTVTLLKEVILLVSSDIREPILDSLRVLLSGSFPPTGHASDSVFLGTLDSYTTGHYMRAIEQAQILISQGSFPIEILEILAKSIPRVPAIPILFSKDCPLSKILSDMQELLLPSKNSGNSFSSLLKLISINQSHSWASRVFSFIVNEHFSNESAYQLENPTDLAVNSNFLNPQLLLAVKEPNERNTIISYLSNIMPGSITVRFYSFFFNDAGKDDSLPIDLNIPNNRRIKYDAQISLRKKNYELAISYYQSLLQDSDPITKKDAMHGLAKAFILADRVGEAVEIVSIGYLENPNFFISLPIKEVLEKVQKNGIKKFSSTIFLPILFGIFSKHFSSERNLQRNEACERFLTFHGLSRPSEFFLKYPEFEKKQLIFFLFSVCQTEVIDSSIVFSSTEEVRQERIQILQQLNEIEPNSSRYSDEIKTLTKRIIIGKNLREIEQSKIYVDIERLTTELEKSIKESFARFCSLKSISLPEGESDAFLLRLFEVIDGLSKDIKLSIPSDESFDLFKAMFLEIRDGFVSSNEFGLDTYLSVRVRHGTLSGQIRGILESFNLIAKKDSITGIYNENDHWRDRLSLDVVDSQKVCSNALRIFSEEVDNLVQELIERNLQISTETRPTNGLFNYSFRNADFLRMRRDCSSLQTHDRFLVFSLGVLWEKTEENLVNVRNEISNRLKERFNSAFQNLQNSIVSANLPNGSSEFLASINNARTALQNCLDRISEWFRRSKDVAHGDYEVELLFEICLEMVKNTYPRWDFSATTNLEKGMKLAGKTLLVLTDVIFLLLDNVVKHSGLSEKIVQVKIDFQREHGFLILRIESPIDPKQNFEERREKIFCIRKRLLSAEGFEVVRKEGGSGFFKVKKLLEIDLGCKTTLDFDILDTKVFRFEARFSEEGITDALSNN